MYWEWPWIILSWMLSTFLKEILPIYMISFGTGREEYERYVEKFEINLFLHLFCYGLTGKTVAVASKTPFPRIRFCWKRILFDTFWIRYNSNNIMPINSCAGLRTTSFATNGRKKPDFLCWKFCRCFEAKRSWIKPVCTF